MDKSAEFWNRIALNYSMKPVMDEAAYQKKLLVTREYFWPDMEVLEIGCGTGSTALIHAPYVKHILAIDISSRMIEIAKGKAEANNAENITFQVSSIDELSVIDQSMDVVLGLSILHLVENKEAVLSKVYRMLKPDGLFVTSTACLGDTMTYIKLIAPIGKLLGFMPLVKVFTAQELEYSLTEVGFKIDYTWKPDKHAVVFIVANKRYQGSFEG